MSGECGPLATFIATRKRNAGLAFMPDTAEDTLLERALDVLHAELAGFIEAHCILRSAGAGGDPLPDLDTLDDDDLAVHADMIALVIDIEDHLGLSDAAFSTASSPWWLRQVIRRGRQLRERVTCAA